MDTTIKILKAYLINFLYFIRLILTVLKKTVIPIYKPNPPVSPHYRYLNEQIEGSFQNFKPYFKSSIFLEEKKIKKYVIEKSKENDNDNSKFYIEFGVWRGWSINYFSKFVKTIYGFDSFEGLSEDWKGSYYPKGTFDLKKKLPKVNKNVVLVPGWIQETLIPFLEMYKPKINFLHLDIDTYESTKFVLEKTKPFISKNCIILFDEFYNHIGWDVGEYKALIEVYNESEYKYICFSTDSEQVAIQII
jgi:hypothetical protein